MKKDEFGSISHNGKSINLDREKIENLEIIKDELMVKYQELKLKTEVLFNK